MDLIFNKIFFSIATMAKILTVHALRKEKLGSKADTQATFNRYFQGL